MELKEINELWKAHLIENEFVVLLIDSEKMKNMVTNLEIKYINDESDGLFASSIGKAVHVRQIPWMNDVVNLTVTVESSLSKAATNGLAVNKKEKVYEKYARTAKQIYASSDGTEIELYKLFNSFFSKLN